MSEGVEAGGSTRVMPPSPLRSAATILQSVLLRRCEMGAGPGSA